MSDGNLISLGKFHRSRGPASDEDILHLAGKQIEPHRFLDAEKVRQAVFDLPQGLRLGREIYVGGMADEGASSWQLAVGIDCAHGEEEHGKLISIKYDLAIRTLDRVDYGDFFSGDLDVGVYQAANVFLMSDLAQAWTDENLDPEDYTGGAIVRKCDLVQIEKPGRTAMKRHGNPVGKEFLVRNRGEVPALVTGYSIDVINREWHVQPGVHIMHEGYPDKFIVPMHELLLPPRPEMKAQPQFLARRAG